MIKGSKSDYGKRFCVPSAFIQIDGKADREHSFAKESEDILYSVAFRKMSTKTQVFHHDVREHLRTRLTHTLEVARIAVNMAEKLGLDWKLAEAIALGHDLGHTPFGHVGERAIHKFSSGEDRKYTTRNGKVMEMPENMRGFKHNLQSVRLLVDYTLESHFSNFVLYGIRGHSSIAYNKLGEKGKTPFYDIYNKRCSIVFQDGTKAPAWSVEAFIVKWADEIAQRHHDIEDAYFQGIMSPRQIVLQLQGLFSLENNESYRSIFLKMKEMAEQDSFVRDREQDPFSRYLTEFVIGVYTECCIGEFQRCLAKMAEKYHIESNETFENSYREIGEEYVKELFSLRETPIEKEDRKLNQGLKYAILDSYEVQRMDGRSEYIVRRLLRAYKSNPQQLPDIYIDRLIKHELNCFLPLPDREEVIKKLVKQFGKDELASIVQWPNYQCRNALRVLLEDLETERKVSPIMMRIIFDYVASMTDQSAYQEYRELYE